VTGPTRDGLSVNPAVSLIDIHKNFGHEDVLKGVSLQVQRGEVVALIGPSGGGKSTLLRCINLLEIPTSGEVHFGGLAVFPATERSRKAQQAALREHRKRVGMVFQQFNLFPHLSVLENVTLAQVRVLGRARPAARARSLELLERVGLAPKADQPPGRLSGGQQQRVAIARALSMEPELMLFDEPTASLDPELGYEVLGVMRELSAEGMTMVVVTHEMHFAEDVADRVALLADGQILEEGTPHEVLKQPKHERTKRFLTAVLDR